MSGRWILGVACIAFIGLAAWSSRGGGERREPDDRVSSRFRLAWPRWRAPRFEYEIARDAGPESDAPSDAGVDAPRYEALERALCEPLAAVFCERKRRCCDVGDGCVERELDECRTWLRCAHPNGETATSVVDDRAVRRCVADATASSRSCANFVLSEMCRDLLVDPAEAGEACASRSAACRGGICADGRCVAYAQHDEPCSDGCARGLICDGDMRCRHPGEVYACLSHAECGVDAYCDHGRCLARRSAGAACDPSLDDHDCAPDLRCDRETSRCARIERCGVGVYCAPADFCAWSRHRCVPNLCMDDLSWMCGEE